ncbi:hypothetical protein CPC08DRAFT_325940 [Agrocybe pediades]|nr:hypothetical protein CPC08DRAFT_325940 [Agrocybe pediades]
MDLTRHHSFHLGSLLFSFFTLVLVPLAFFPDVLLARIVYKTVSSRLQYTGNKPVRHGPMLKDTIASPPRFSNPVSLNIFI